ncbi:Nif11-like leader peptide family natural product precursor [Synechococcus sp. UW105]|uniref:Nif11-like leader peptide family natural product precursor n=1 Tax=Synechococcus sp. UW105 TaxID=337067 RepID=UPI001FCBC7A7|nr:Nif11-like leader peptide family natural product precursor [Synechococcus sp. UW105]
MSEEQLKAFIAKVKADTSLQEQLKAEGADPVAIAKAAGFSITTEDLKEDRQTLSDDELEGVAGGGSGYWDCGKEERRGRRKGFTVTEANCL